MKTTKLNNIFKMFLSVMVLVLAGCSEYDGPFDGPNISPTPDPETKLEKVEKVSCTTVSSTWDSENVRLNTRSSYDAMYRDGAFWAVSKVDYKAKLTYSDAKVTNQTKQFSVTNNVNAFWGNKIGYIKDINSLKSTPSTEVRPIEEGTLNFISWKGIWNVALVVKNTKSTNSLDFGGKTMNDLCTPEMKLTFKKVIITDLQKDSLNFHLYEVAVVVDAEIGEGENDYREVTLGAKKFWMSKDGSGTIPGTDPEIVVYELRNQGFEYKTPLTSRSYAALVAIYTDGTEKEIQKIETTVNNYSKVQDKQEFVVPNFNYIENEPRIFKMVSDGSERVSTENSNISLKGYQTTYYTGSNYFSCLYEGHFEIPTFTDPLGKKHTMLYKEYDMADMGIIRGSIKTEGAYQILPLTAKVNATFNERTYDLSAEVDLKTPSGGVEEKLTGLSVINVRVINEYIHYDLVRYFPSQNTTTAMKVLHGAIQTAEQRKDTKDRNYNATSSLTDTLSKTAFTDGKHSGRLVKFNKTYHYSDFDNVITNEVRDNIIYSEGGFSALIFAGNPNCDKVGSVLGTEDLGNERQHIYDDVINYALNIGSVKAAGSTQVVRYTNDIPVPEKKLVSVDEYKVTGNEHIIKITYDDGSFEYDTVTVAKPVTLQGGVINDLNRDNVVFGKGTVDHSQTPSSGNISTSGRVTATPYTHTYPVSYNNHNHNVTGTYNKYKYTYAYKGVEKSCNLTSPTLNVENTSVDLGTTRKDTVDLKIYENTPVTFVYSGTYGNQTAPATVKTNNINYIGNVVIKTGYIFAGMARIASPDRKSFYNGIILNVSGEQNGYRIIIPQIGYDKFYDKSTVLNSGKIEAAVWNGAEYLPCEVLVDNKVQIFAYDAQNTASNIKLPMTFAEALIAGIKNYSGNINVTVTPIITGASAVKSNGKTIISLGGTVVYTIKDEVKSN